MLFPPSSTSPVSLRGSRTCCPHKCWCDSYVDPTDAKLSGAFHERIEALRGNVDGQAVGLTSVTGDPDMEGTRMLLGMAILQIPGDWLI